MDEEIEGGNEFAPLPPRDEPGPVFDTLFFRGPVQQNIKLVQSYQGTFSPRLVGLKGVQPGGAIVYQLPAPVDCVGPDYLVSNKHFTCVLRRQGGVIRELIVGDKVVAKEHDLYGDQEYFHAGDSSRIAAGNDVESGIRIWAAKEWKELHLSFEGQLRGFGRFDLKRPPLWYRNEYVFTDKPTFKQKWAFRTEKSFKDKTAFLAAIVQLPEADRFRFLRDGEAIAEDAVEEGGPRRGQTKGGPAPGRVEFLKDGKVLFGLTGLTAPEDSSPNVFVHGRQFFIALLDGKSSGMNEGRWYEFEAEWQMGGQR